MDVPFSSFERMVAFRYLRARREEGLVSVIAVLSFLGITLGVATLIIVMSVINGYRTQLLEEILGLNGHISIVAGPSGHEKQGRGRRRETPAGRGRRLPHHRWPGTRDREQGVDRRTGARHG